MLYQVILELKVDYSDCVQNRKTGGDQWVIPARSTSVEAILVRSRDIRNITSESVGAGAYQENWRSLLEYVPVSWMEKRFGECREGTDLIVAPASVDVEMTEPPRGVSPLGEPIPGHKAEHYSMLEDWVNRCAWNDDLVFTDDEAMKRSFIAIDLLPADSPVKFDRNRRMLQFAFARTEQFLNQTQAPSDRPNVNEREDLLTSGNAFSSFLACSSRCATSYVPGKGLTKSNAQVIAKTC